MPSDFVSFNYPQCINHLILKVDLKELDKFENNLFTSSFSQEMKNLMKIIMLIEKYFSTLCLSYR